MNRTISRLLLATITAAALAATAAAQNPYEKANNTWISISGTVDAVDRDSFLLDYGKGVITVEMDDGDRDADAYKLLQGDSVTVSGMIDDDFFERTTIEASTVYVEKLGTYFYASAVDEEDFDRFIVDTTPVVISQTVIRGTVSKVMDDEFVVNTGNRKIMVETDALAYDPLDDEGYQQIERGDRVSVAGRIDDDLFEGRELVASSVITLSDASEQSESDKDKKNKKNKSAKNNS